ASTECQGHGACAWPLESRDGASWCSPSGRVDPCMRPPVRTVTTFPDRRSLRGPALRTARHAASRAPLVGTLLEQCSLASRQWTWCILQDVPASTDTRLPHGHRPG